MRLYQTRVQTGADSYVTKWAGTQAEASKHRVALKKEKHAADVMTTEVDVPTNKTGFLEFLNDSGVSI